MRKGDAQSANGNGKILIIIIDSFKFKGAFVVRYVDGTFDNDTNPKSKTTNNERQ